MRLLNLNLRLCLVMICLLSAINASPALAQGQFPGTGSRADWLKANGFFAEGNHLLQAKKYASAIEKYKEAIAIYPADHHYFLNLGLAQKKQGDLAAAEDSLRRGTQVNSSDWRLWQALGNCLYQTGQYKEALDALQHSLRAGAPRQAVSEIKQGMAACAARK